MTIRITVSPRLKEEIFALKTQKVNKEKYLQIFAYIYDITYGIAYVYLVEFHIVIVPTYCENE